MQVLLQTTKSASLPFESSTNPLTRHLDDGTSFAFERRRISFFFHALSWAPLLSGSRLCLLLLTLLPPSTNAISLATCLFHESSEFVGFGDNRQYECQALHEHWNQKSRPNQQPRLKRDATRLRDATHLRGEIHLRDEIHLHDASRPRDAHGFHLLVTNRQGSSRKMDHRHSLITKLRTPKTPLTRTRKNLKMKTGVPLVEGPG